MDIIYGIDLGTTNSAVAVNLNGVAEIVPVSSERTTPSVVMYNEDGSVEVGHAIYPFRYLKDVVYSSKRHMGTDKVYDLGHHKVKPYEVGGEVLKYLKRNIDSSYPKLEKAVITVPAYFTDAQRRDTMKAAEYAGIECVRIINEPTAAALCFAHNHFIENNGDKSETYLVVDVGGGTTDVTLITISYINEVPELLAEVLHPGFNFHTNATGGNNFLGGDDYDRYILEELEKELGEEFPNRDQMLYKISSEKPSILSTSKSITFKTKTGKTVNYDSQVAERAFMSFWNDIVKCIYECLGTREFPSQCILVGGSTKNPLIEKAIRKFYLSRYQNDLNLIIPDTSFADESVALGAAYLAAHIANPDATNILIKDVNPLPVGIEVVGTDALGVDKDGVFLPLIDKDVSLPVNAYHNIKTTVDNQESMSIKIFQGINSETKYNHYMGELNVEGIEPGEAGSQQALIHLSINYEGVVSIEATYNDKVTKLSLSSVLGCDQSKIKKLSIKDRINKGFMGKAISYFKQHGMTDLEEMAKAWNIGQPIPPEIEELRETINTTFTAEINV